MNHLTELFGEIIDVYTAKQAIQDGVLKKVGEFQNGIPIYFTRNLLNETNNLQQIVEKTIKKLKQKNPEDDKYMKLRVVEKNKIWAVLNTEGLTIMKPEDY